MILFTLSIVSFLAAAIVGLVQTHTSNVNGRRVGQLERQFDVIFFHKIFGVHVAVCHWIGNCFSPALVFKLGNVLPYRPANRFRKYLASGVDMNGAKMSNVRCRSFQKRLDDASDNCHKLYFPSFCTVTFRSGGSETNIHFRLKGTNWNSEHLANRFGKRHESDFNPSYSQWTPPAILRPLIGKCHSAF